jgi:hypothetical protein
MEYQEIDFNDLKNHLVEKAFDRAGLVLTPEQRQRLIDDKIERAGIEIAARKQFTATSQY